MEKINIRATSLGAYVSCPYKSHLDKTKNWGENNALAIWTIVHLARQSPLLAKMFFERLIEQGKINAKEKIMTHKMIDIIWDIKKEIPDKYEISFEANLEKKITFNDWEIECIFTGHPDEIWINKETWQIEKIVDTKTSGAVAMWKDFKMLDYARQHIYYPYLLSNQAKLGETVEFIYRVIPKSFFNASDITNLKIVVNVEEAIKETEKDVLNYITSLLTNKYEAKKNVQCVWCDYKHECPLKNILNNL